jgi:hypothetical protein
MDHPDCIELDPPLQTHRNAEVSALAAAIIGHAVVDVGVCGWPTRIRNSQLATLSAPSHRSEPANAFLPHSPLRAE